MFSANTGLSENHAGTRLDSSSLVNKQIAVTQGVVSTPTICLNHIHQKLCLPFECDSLSTFWFSGEASFKSYFCTQHNE